MEIYNEVISDLLSTLPESGHCKVSSLTVVEGGENGVYVKGLSRHLANNEEEALNFLFEVTPRPSLVTTSAPIGADHTKIHLCIKEKLKHFHKYRKSSIRSRDFYLRVFTDRIQVVGVGLIIKFFP